ncbi:MAG: IS630 family transposase [Bifidobacteriaceae bacterium]|jgi:transposase|nr:IS630 family transposase [Bifidobacteriaceae bacterium]
MASSPARIVLSAEERTELSALVKPTAEHRMAARAKIVLAAARGDPNVEIAAGLGVSRETVRKWRGRYAAERLPGLGDRPRPGRPRRYTPVQVAEVKAIACSKPEDRDVPLARWSVREIARQAEAEHVAAVSPATVARWLRADKLRPWQVESWISPRDPDFAAKGGAVLDLYQRIWEGRELRDTEFVISADEKTGIQALRRVGANRPLAPGGPTRVESDYRRGGTVCYLAAMDVGSGEVMGVVDQTCGIAPFGRLVGEVMGREPYASAEKVYWVCDNGSSHRGANAQVRLQDAYPNAVLVHTPVHASWLNQIEVFFSILTRKALTGASFDNVDALTERILAFQDWYNLTAQPFNWTWDRAKLNQYLRRLGDISLAA